MKIAEYYSLWINAKMSEESLFVFFSSSIYVHKCVKLCICTVTPVYLTQKLKKKKEKLPPQHDAK